jgi:hypothetical protein
MQRKLLWREKRNGVEMLYLAPLLIWPQPVAYTIAPEEKYRVLKCARLVGIFTSPL